MIERVLNDFDIDQIAKLRSVLPFPRGWDKSYSLIAGTHLLNIQQNGRTVRFDCDEDELTPSGGRISIWMRTTAAAKLQLPNAIPICRTPLHTAADYVFCGRICGRLFYALSSPSRTISRGLPSVSWKLCFPFGETCYNKSEQVYNSIPTAERLAACTPEDLTPVRLGYRAKYICAAARQVASGEVDLEAVRHMDYAHAKAALLRLTGVGIKVAECICLFALHHIDAFPVDTHIRQMLDAHYPKGFPLKRYKGFAGVMQQYAFYYEYH